MVFDQYFGVTVIVIAFRVFRNEKFGLMVLGNFIRLTFLEHKLLIIAKSD